MTVYPKNFGPSSLGADIQSFSGPISSQGVLSEAGINLREWSLNRFPNSTESQETFDAEHEALQQIADIPDVDVSPSEVASTVAADDLGDADAVGDAATTATEFAGAAQIGMSAAAAPIVIASQIATAAIQSVNEYKSTTMQTNASNKYAGDLANGHGIGYQSVALQNYNTNTATAANFSTYSRVMGSLFGPAGALIATLTPGGLFSPNTSSGNTFNAETAGGETANAQSTDVIDNDSV